MTEQERLLKWLKSAPLDDQRPGVRVLDHAADPLTQRLSAAVAGLSHLGPPLRTQQQEELELLP